MGKNAPWRTDRERLGTLRDGRLAVPAIQVEQGLHRKGFSALAPRLRAHDAHDCRHHDIARRSDRWPTYRKHHPARSRQTVRQAVSYTHLTLPTIYSV